MTIIERTIVTQFIVMALVDTTDSTNTNTTILYNSSSTQIVDVRDVAGAGDTFIAAFTAALIKTRHVETSIFFANECATHVIQKRGVVDISDMIKLFNDL